jgi:hypothetical protein
VSNVGAEDVRVQCATILQEGVDFVDTRSFYYHDDRQNLDCPTCCDYYHGNCDPGLLNCPPGPPTPPCPSPTPCPTPTPCPFIPDIDMEVP